ncbi:MAG TPA: Fe-S cluster assembly protein SufD [Thermoanaerobaculia bacterium]
MTAVTSSSVVSEGVESLAAAAQALAQGPSPRWLEELRKEALAAFADRGLPTPKDEAWRFTDLGPVARQPWRQDQGGAPLHYRPAALEAFLHLSRIVSPTRKSHKLVFVNGRLDAELSSPDGLPTGIRFEPISRILKTAPDDLRPHLGLTGAHRRHPLAALNTAALADGACLQVDAGVVAQEPFHVVHVTDASAGPTASHPRFLVVLGENAQASVVESFVGPDDEHPAFVNGLAEVYLGPHATLDQTTLQEEGKSTLHVGTLWTHQDRGSQLFSHLISVGGRIARSEVTAALHGEGASLTLDGLLLGKGEQQVDLRTLIDHAKPHGGSQEYVKGIFDGSARGAFEGKIVVRPNAQKTDAHQKNRNLILSREALVDTKPQLEIYNDDVKCTHGSTTGRLDADALFYLRSRGLGEPAARSLLTAAFAAEIAERVKVETVREYLHHRILRWLPEEAA